MAHIVLHKAICILNVHTVLNISWDMADNLMNRVLYRSIRKFSLDDIEECKKIRDYKHESRSTVVHMASCKVRAISH